MTFLRQHTALIATATAAVSGWYSAHDAHDRVDDQQAEVSVATQTAELTHEQLVKNYQAFVQRIEFLADQANITHALIFERLDQIDRRTARGRRERAARPTEMPLPEALPPLPAALPPPTSLSQPGAKPPDAGPFAPTKENSP